jgi:hypothetical protein
MLAELTNQQITGTVVGFPAPAGQFTWSFQFVSAALGNYKYELLRITHPITLYPLSLSYAGRQAVPVENEDAFREQLKALLSSDETTRTINALLSQIST